VLYAVDPCTGAGDANFNGDGFLSVPAIDGHLYSDPLVGAVRVTAASPGATRQAIRLNADLVAGTTPSMAVRGEPRRSRMLTVPAGVVLGGGSSPAPVGRRTARSSSGRNPTNQQVLFALQGDAALGSPWRTFRDSAATGVGVKCRAW